MIWSEWLNWDMKPTWTGSHNRIGDSGMNDQNTDAIQALYKWMNAFVRVQRLQNEVLVVSDSVAGFWTAHQRPVPPAFNLPRTLGAKIFFQTVSRQTINQLVDQLLSKHRAWGHWPEPCSMICPHHNGRWDCWIDAKNQELTIGRGSLAKGSLRQSNKTTGTKDQVYQISDQATQSPASFPLHNERNGSHIKRKVLKTEKYDPEIAVSCMVVLIVFRTKLSHRLTDWPAHTQSLNNHSLS